MSKLYTSGPQGIPEEFTKAKKSFKQRVFWAILALSIFILVYTGLMVWFGVRSYKLLKYSGDSRNPIFAVIAGVCLGVLAIFMLKSLLIFRSKRDGKMRELKPSEEPELFSYIMKLADEVELRDHIKIILTSRVNASVFYDLSIFNLLIPSKKNLEIGLGLINVLNLGEFKAVLAHEFGHFAQRSMLLGRYVYTAQQIAERVVNKRDALDKIIRFISSIDLRVAWIGWIISILVWGIRSLIDVLFSVVVFAERALSREMEFQADKVAVSVTGSDALIHALFKLRAADEGYNAGISTLNTLLNRKLAAPDLYTLQTNYIEKTRWILDDPNYGKSPEIEGRNGEHRVFKNRIVNPPEMWATHPADLDREENAKEEYIYAEIDKRSAWELFSNARKIREEITAELIQTAGLETELISSEESVEVMNREDYNWTFLNPRYKGSYLQRFSFINFKSVNDIYNDGSEINIDEGLNKLYRDELKELLERHKEVQEEIKQLTVVQYEVLTAERRRIMHRGNEIKRGEVPSIIEELKKEELSLRNDLMEHDVLCRRVTHKIAKGQDGKLADYLVSISQLIHYSEHSIRNIDDAVAKFHNTLNVVTADGKVTKEEMTNLLNDCKKLGEALFPVYNASGEMKIPQSIELKIGAPYAALFEKYQLGTATNENINDWVQNAQSWVEMALRGLYKLRNGALELLLDTEQELLLLHKENKPVTAQVEEASVIEGYALLMPGDERKIQYKLRFWDRFVAGVGIVPTAAKFMTSVGLVLIAIWGGSDEEPYDYSTFLNSQFSDLHMHNDLGVWVKVNIDGTNHRIAPHSTEYISLPVGSYRIRSITNKGDVIDDFNVSMMNFTSDYIYNVGNAGYFYSYDIHYGENAPQSNNQEFIGAERFFISSADYILEEPEESVASRYGIAKRTALTTMHGVSPGGYPGIFEPDRDLKKSIVSHATWDPTNDPDILTWMYLSSIVDPECTIARNRLKVNPSDIIATRHLQDNLEGDELREFNMDLMQRAEGNMSDPNMLYLVIRTLEDGPEQDKNFILGSEKWPNHGWLNFASSHINARRGNWNDAAEDCVVAMNKVGALRSTLITDLARFVRMANRKIDGAEDLLMNSNYIKYIESLEAGGFNGDETNFDQAYYYLSEGNVSKAIRYAHGFSREEYSAFDWYAAASKGATDLFINKVLDYSIEETVNSENASVALALLARGGRSFETIINEYGSSIGFDEDIDLLVSFVKGARAGRYGEANKIISKCQSYRQQMQLRLIGSIIAGNKAPREWVSLTNKMMFITERPFL